MRQPSHHLYPPISTGNTDDIIHDLRVIYGPNLERLDTKAKRHLMIICALATEFGWTAATTDFFLGHSVPDGVVALAHNLDYKGLLTLNNALTSILRCGDPLIIPEPNPTPWQRFAGWLRSFLPI
jgi:hypothetical protein